MVSDDEDPQNKLSDDTYANDKRDAFFLKNDDGTTTIMRKYGGEWHEFRTGGRDEGGEDGGDE